jgi:Uma2 family endonuclease
MITRLTKDCVFYAPFEVRLPGSPDRTADSQIYTVVQPDICVICDPSGLDERGCLGAPDMVVEILSPSSQPYDRNEKFRLYRAGGVKEYRMVSPRKKEIRVFILRDDGQYDAGTIYAGDSQAPVRTLRGLRFDLNALFGE